MPKTPCVGMPFTLATRLSIDLSRAESFSFWYRNPNGVTGTIEATESSSIPGRITGLIPSSVNTLSGEWQARVLVKWDYDEEPARGKIAKFVVIPESE